MDRKIPRWAVTALIGGKFYRRTLAPDMWVPEENGPSMTTKEVEDFPGNVAFYATGQRF